MTPFPCLPLHQIVMTGYVEILIPQVMEITFDPDRPWSIPMITWINDFVSNVFTAQYVQNHNQIDERRLHCDVTHFSLTTGVVAWYIPSWRFGVREERCQERTTVWPVNEGRLIFRHQNDLYGVINHPKKIHEFGFGGISRWFKHNYNEPHRYWRPHSIVTHAPVGAAPTTSSFST